MGNVHSTFINLNGRRHEVRIASGAVWYRDPAGRSQVWYPLPPNVAQWVAKQAGITLDSGGECVESGRDFISPIPSAVNSSPLPRERPNTKWKLDNLVLFVGAAAFVAVNLFLFYWFVCSGKSVWEAFWLVVGVWMLLGIVLFALWLFMAPTIIARRRHHPNTMAIAIVNLLFGYTILGWGIALAWSLVGLPEKR